MDLDAAWFQKLDVLKAFVVAHNRLPYTTESFDGVKIGAWCNRQRQAYKGTGKKPLTEKQKAVLESVSGWWWDSDAAWFQKLDMLKAFVAAHSRLPSQKESFDGVKIGAWCTTQRQAYKGNAATSAPLSEEKKASLENVPGWWWTKR